MGPFHHRAVRHKRLRLPNRLAPPPRFLDNPAVGPSTPPPPFVASRGLTHLVNISNASPAWRRSRQSRASCVRRRDPTGSTVNTRDETFVCRFVSRWMFQKFDFLFFGFIRSPVGAQWLRLYRRSSGGLDIVCTEGISCRKHLESSSITRMEHEHTHTRLHTCRNYLIFSESPFRLRRK